VWQDITNQFIHSLIGWIHGSFSIIAKIKLEMKNIGLTLDNKVILNDINVNIGQGYIHNPLGL